MGQWIDKMSSSIQSSYRALLGRKEKQLHCHPSLKKRGPMKDSDAVGEERKGATALNSSIRLTNRYPEWDLDRYWSPEKPGRVSRQKHWTEFSRDCLSHKNEKQKMKKGTIRIENFKNSFLPRCIDSGSSRRMKKSFCRVFVGSRGRIAFTECATFT